MQLKESEPHWFALAVIASGTNPAASSVPATIQLEFGGLIRTVAGVTPVAQASAGVSDAVWMAAASVCAAARIAWSRIDAAASSAAFTWTSAAS